MEKLRTSKGSDEVQRNKNILSLGLEYFLLPIVEIQNAGPLPIIQVNLRSFRGKMGKKKWLEKNC